MKRAATWLILLAIAAGGCRTLTGTSAGARDTLVGWYDLPHRHYRTREVIPVPGTLIPVFKRDGVYYSVCRGVEVPLKGCPEGLEWGSAESSMKGTKIGFDEASRKSYIIIEDANAQYEGDYSTSGEKQYMTRIDKPSWLLDPTAKPPRTNDDFTGCYQPVWFPVFRWIIAKDGDKYHIEGQTADKDKWKSEESESAELMPLPDTLGFVWGIKKDVKLVYNESLNRFECVLSDSLRMPLVRVMPSLPAGAGVLPMAIGIPSWH